VRPIAVPRGHTHTALHRSKGCEPEKTHSIYKEQLMLHYAVVFFVIALIAALFGFGGIAAGAVGIAKILFVVFAVLAVASFLFGLLRKG
jgi:uncharacterized membrane protein YtjA (UPF0391 family)